MQSATVGSTAISYTYNSDGYRTSKTVDGVKTVYVLDGSKVIMEQTGTGTPIYYTYDAAGLPTTMTVGSTTYYYVYNLQGDIIAITNNNGIKVVEYTYDPWGKLISITGSSASTIGVQNPYRYRAYRYDTELEMYYLNSRYYDPEIGRFINADDVMMLGANSDIISYNLFAYCVNNPIMRSDPSGFFSWGDVYRAAFCVTAVALAVAVLVGTGGTAAPILATIGAALGTTVSASAVTTAALGVAVTGATVMASVTMAKIVDTFDDDFYDNDENFGGRERMGRCKGKAPRNNQAQNSQFKAATSGRSFKIKERVHRSISGEGLNYHEIKDAAKYLVVAIFFSMFDEE